MNNQSKQEKIWGCLLHLSFNMWEEYVWPGRPFRGFRPDLRLSESLWNDALETMAKEGVNMVIIDLGDAVRYESHPEIAVHNAWSTDRLQSELKKIRDLGMEPIPKLNFSAGHDTWLKEYSRMVSTDEYYKVCADLILEVCHLFGNPRYFHLGMDEESVENQSSYKYMVVRRNDTWWGDFYFLTGEVEKNGSRTLIWPDYMLWNQPAQFFKNMPRSVVQSNWYYGMFKSPDQKYVKEYIELNTNGYDQIPTGSYHENNSYSIGETVRFCKEHLDDTRILGYMQTFWKPTIEENRERILEGIRLLGEAKRTYY